MDQSLRKEACHNRKNRLRSENVHEPCAGAVHRFRTEGSSTGHPHRTRHHQHPSEGSLVAKPRPWGKEGGTIILGKDDRPGRNFPENLGRIGHLHKTHLAAQFRRGRKEVARLETAHGQGELRPHRWTRNFSAVRRKPGRKIYGHNRAGKICENLDGPSGKPLGWAFYSHP